MFKNVFIYSTPIINYAFKNIYIRMMLKITPRMPQTLASDSPSLISGLEYSPLQEYAQTINTIIAKKKNNMYIYLSSLSIFLPETPKEPIIQ